MGIQAFLCRWLESLNPLGLPQSYLPPSPPPCSLIHWLHCFIFWLDSILLLILLLHSSISLLGLPSTAGDHGVGYCCISSVAGTIRPLICLSITPRDSLGQLLLLWSHSPFPRLTLQQISAFA